MGRDAVAIIRELESGGLRAAFLPYSAMGAVRGAYARLTAEAGDLEYPKGAARHFEANQPPDIPFEPLSLLAVAIPGEGAALSLSVGGERIAIPIPAPHHSAARSAEIGAIIASALEGVLVAHTRGISQKLIAALSGLGAYGRNNLCYIEGYGSRFGLRAFYTDVPFEGSAAAARLMAECEGCSLCRDACPTGAIAGGPTIDATRCLSMYNEVEGEIPDWAPSGAHRALSGCMACQDACPANAPSRAAAVLELSEAETGELLSREAGDLSEGLASRMAGFGMDGRMISVAGRNALLYLRRLGAPS